MANTLNKLQLGQREAASLFGWGRDTLRKAGHELRTGLTWADAYCLRGRQPVELHLPHLFDDLRGLVQDHLQTDPTFQTTGLYCRLSAPEVRQPLITPAAGTPTSSYHPCEPSTPSSTSSASPGVTVVEKPSPKKVKETDAIFQNLTEVHRRAAGSEDTLRLFLRCQSPRPHRAILARRQEPPWYQRCRPRLQALGKA